MIGGPPLASARSRDFLMVRRSGQRPEVEPLQGLLAWHSGLGGSLHVWSSRRLACQLWGPPPAVSMVWEAGTPWHLACVLTGAPAGFGSLDPEWLQTKLLDAYTREGLSALTAIEGSFCGVIVDERAGAFVFTDRFGFRKSFVVRTADATYASSRAVVLGRGLGLPPDPAGVVTCTVIGHTLGRRTLFESCAAVMPASAVDVISGREQCYWRIARHLAERPIRAADAHELRERFNAACASFVVAQSRPALNVTGGFDTRAVLSGALLTGRPLLGVTSGILETTSVDAVVAAAGIEHRYFPYSGDPLPDGNAAFSLLTDGEWDATGGGALVDYWQRVGAATPAGCLHGGMGEVWRSYHYKFLWPAASTIRRDPVGYLTDALCRPRAHMVSVLHSALRKGVRDLVRQDAASLWSFAAGGNGELAAVDAFYLLERQRGLTRVASAADLWNPVYMPFGHSVFCETALGFLGLQNRSETLHRSIVQANSPALAALERPEGGACQPLTPARVMLMQARATARHLAGRSLGRKWRRRLKPSMRLCWDGHHLDIERLGSLGLYDVVALGRMLRDDAAADGLGNVAAIALAGAAACPRHRDEVARPLEDMKEHQATAVASRT